MKVIYFISLAFIFIQYSFQSSAKPTSNKDVIIQMFEWNWDSIAEECTNFIGPAGYGYVQASPAQEHIEGDQWWTDYQPVSYILTSKRGNREQYQNMIKVCAEAGVGIIADTIFNHMVNIPSGSGVAGSNFTQFNYPGIYNSTNFHYCGLEPNNVVVNYDNRLEVQTCELDGLADLFTETEYVRSTLAAYTNDLLAVGVVGLRLDAAKSIAASDIANITSQLHNKPYITQEVIWGAGQPIQPSEYIGIGDVQEFRCTTALQDAFLNSGISRLHNMEDDGWVPSNVANVFVADHDTERNGGSLNANSPSNTYTLAHIFMLAYPYGTPTILSSYSGFTNTDMGAPNNGEGSCYGSGGVNGWLCQHRWTAIAGMVEFHNEARETALVNWMSPNSQRVAFGRKGAGFVAINNNDTAWPSSFSTSMPAGSYCDVVGGGAVAINDCSGASFVVSVSGTLSGVIPGRSAIAIHIGAKGQSKLVSVIFQENATTVWGENIFLAGNIKELGSWDTDKSIALSSAAYPFWEVVVKIPPNTAFEYKFIRKEQNNSIIWESGANRYSSTPFSGSQLIQTNWH